jgi:phosphoglycerol transferase MdoB-like AlkP superfamily enzyme
VKLTQRVSDWLERHRSSRFVLLVGVAMALKALLVRWLALGHALGPGAIADVAFILAVALFVSLLEGRLARRGMAVLDVIFSIGCVAVVLYVSYFGQLPTTQTFALSSQAHDLGDDVSALLSWVHVLLIIDIPFVLWRSFRAAPERRPRKRRFAFGIVALLLVAAFCAVAVVNPLA